MTDAAIATATSPAPRWTVPSFRRTPGRYPLGIEAVNFTQLDELASGLPVLSQHPRYWSIYTYIIKHYWDLGLTPQTNAGLGRFLKPHEIVFASAALLCQDHPELPGILGRNSLAPHLREAPDDMPMDLPYLDQRLGGYGQVYRGAMSDLGLILSAENNPGARLDAPLGALGAAVADTFAKSIAGTTYARDHADQTEGSIPLGVIRELSEASCFHRLAAGGGERDLLVSVLVGDAQPSHPAHKARAATVRLFLDLARSTADLVVDEARFRRLLYWGADDTGGSWRPSDGVVDTWRRWWLVRHRELVVGALNALFVHQVLWGLDHGGLLRSLPLSDYFTSTVRSQMPTDIGLGSARLDDLRLRSVVAMVDDSVREDGWPMSPSPSRLQEDLILDSADRGRSPDAPAAALAALIIALRRLSLFDEASGASATDRQVPRVGGAERAATAMLREWLERRLEADDSMADALSDLVRKFVVRQHLRIARTKLPEDTFRFHEDAGSLRYVDQGDRNGLNPISIRFNAVASALSELGLVAAPFGRVGHGPTALGEGLLGG